MGCCEIGSLCGTTDLDSEAGQRVGERSGLPNSMEIKEIFLCRSIERRYVRSLLM